MRYRRIEVRKWLTLFFHFTGQPIQSPEALKLFRMSKSSCFQAPPKYSERLVVDLERHRERVPVFAAVHERKSRRIGKPAGRSVHDLRDKSQGLQRSWSEPLNKE
jgi:hypothetical protein